MWNKKEYGNMHPEGTYSITVNHTQNLTLLTQSLKSECILLLCIQQTKQLGIEKMKFT